LVAAAFVGTGAFAADAPRNLIEDGAFEQVPAGGKPAAWEFPNYMSPSAHQVMEEAGNRFIRFTNDDLEKVVGMQSTFPLPAGTRLVVISARLRTSGIRLGEGWREPRIVTRFLDAKDQEVNPNPGIPNLRFDSNAWVTRTVIGAVPDGATKLQLQPALWGTIGQFDVDDVRITPYENAADYWASRAIPTPSDPSADAFANAGAWDLPDDLGTIIDADGQRVLQITNSAPEADVRATGIFAIDPKSATLAVSLRAKMANFQAGTTDWKLARITGEFVDKEGKQLTEFGIGTLAGNGDWKPVTADATVPPEARYLRFGAGFAHAAGVLSIADLRINSAAEAAAGDATLPADQQANFGKADVQRISDTRDEMSLNGVWKFVPATGDNAREPKAGWGYIKVPANWKDDASFVARGQGRAWQQWKPDELAAAWYERPLKVPAAWAERAVVVDIDRVSTDAVVYVDGQEAGNVTWPAGQVDVTKFVKPGTEQTLRLRVIATDNKTEVTSYMGYVNEPKSKAVLDNRGLIGDGVKLLARPAGAHVFGVYVRPSTRQKRIDVDVELAGVPAAGDVTLKAEMLDEQGKVEQTFTQTLPLAGAKDSPTVLAAGVKVVTASWPWANPRLWDYRQPNRYTMRLTVTPAGGAADQYVQPFGFREFWIDGRSFYLNNTLYNLRPQVLHYGGMPAKYLKLNYNFGELWPNDRGRRGYQDSDDKSIAEASAIGFPIAAKAMHLGDYAASYEKWQKPDVRAEWRRLMEIDLRRWRNSPGVVMWAHTANVFQNTGDGDPRELGMVGVSNQQEQVNRNRNVRDAIGMMKELDPVRPVFAHHGSDHGEVFTSNFYLNFIPLQEREEWMAYWAKNAKLPFIAIEFGTPLYASLNRDKDGYSRQGQSEPSLTEWMAVHLGHEAYKLEPTDLRKLFTRFVGPTPDHRDEYAPHQRHDGFDKILWTSASFAKFQNDWFRNTWRSWRTMGVTGMGIPWHQDDPTHFPELYKNNDDTLAWIAGPAGETGTNKPTDPAVPNFTRKDHHVASGGSFQKQVVLINDARSPQPFSATWTVAVGDATITDGSKEGQLAVGEKLFLPVDVKAPAQIDGAAAQGKVTLTASIGQAKHADEFAFTVIAPPTRVIGTVVAFDPVGETSKLLTQLGYEVKLWTAGEPAANVAVIGAKALSDRHVVPGDLDAFVKKGGRLVVFGQENDWMRLSLQLRTAPHVSRRVYKVPGEHAVTAGLSDDNLRDWNGAGSLVEAYPYYPGSETLNNYGWRWGNRGSVTSAAIEKPHRSSFRPILETEFDLAYSPLMEMEYGRGRITLCTLDFEARGQADPAAERLLAQMMEHVRTAPIPAKAERVVYVGDDRGAKVLDDLGVIYVEAADVPADAQVVIVGGGGDVTVARRAAEAGAKVLVLARPAGTHGNVSVESKADYQGSINVPNWPECAGLSPSDLHWKTTHDGLPITGGQGIEVGADGLLAREPVGKGVVLFTQIDPTYLPADQKRYFRFTRWRQTRALSQLLSNLGASFKQDAKFVALLQQPEQGYMLAGEWEVALTVPLKESPTRQWNAVQPISEQAKRLVQAGPGEGDGWQTVSVPAFMESYAPAEKWRWTDGECVFRTVIDVPDYLAGRDMFISVGRVDETEETFVNGTSIGTSRSWNLPRGHKVPGALIAPGRNVIALRTWDEGIHGGLAGAAEQYFIRVDGEDAGFYHPDYITDQVTVTDATAPNLSAQEKRWFIADNPYRYTRW
jgi:beta-galactosidase